MSRHISNQPATPPAVGSLPPSLRISTALGTILDVAGVAADVGQSPAYDGTANSPEPVFRKLANTVDVHFTYHGEPGTVSVTAELSTPGDWHSTVPLDGSATFTGNDHEGSIRLELGTLEAKAQAASAVTGLPVGPVTIAVTPQVTTVTGAEFRPKLNLHLTPLQLTLTGAPDTLTVIDATTTQQTVLAPRMLRLNGVGISATVARVVSAVLLLAALAIGVIIMVFARRTTPGDEGTAIRRRYAALLVRVHPMPAPHGRPVIDVTTFPTLAKLAERYGLLVLHWSRSGVETFVVQDENITYRYGAGSDSAQAEPQPHLVDVQP
ncbi:DUF5305 family protein [Arthrobacter sp. Soil762]|uniref:DUF5305 family protein n=1 Tax=Arthrobacter sp. Soil762 TaxID=1736401 RepID=UPI0006FD73A0|nr:DUF5305 family protein [Arthrobacter sp. Soil762]KRE74469.1 hypothetical protein ASG77_07125 [Arthrobacter sp. Soil762]